MMQFQRALLLLAAVAASPAAALDIALPQVKGFQIGHQQRSGRAVLVELVPVGQTVQKFDKMITLMTTPGAGTMPSANFVALFAKRYVATCPGSIATPVPMGKAAGGIRIDCSRHPKTGKAETVFARALPVGPDMALVQYMTAYMTMPAEAQFARNYLGSVALR
ncbi:hypothetical protein [Glacieibacterium frigidum]|uniref:Uncharacterized protein n=1 Tax=Glacieibacterium frigidum TaxID=2593303 RepID=A0A552U7P6_9SPHN|nr:hypothetical protein [Glacieibacterium frigidum]TRW14242.1 hypothetical protein FMM06_11020 [Glacieibacterium frigidum]